METPLTTCLLLLAVPLTPRYQHPSFICYASAQRLFLGTRTDLIKAKQFHHVSLPPVIWENNERDPQRAPSLRSFKAASRHPAPCAANGEVIQCDGGGVTLGRGPLGMKRTRRKERKGEKKSLKRGATRSVRRRRWMFALIRPDRHLNSNPQTNIPGVRVSRLN